MKEKLYMLLGFLLLVLFGWIAYEIVMYIYKTLKDLDSKIILGIVGTVTTIISSVWIASYNARKSKEKIVYEAHKEKKAKIYNDFMDIMVTTLMKNVREGKEVDSKELEKFFDEFTAKLIIYGGSNVINAYIKFRNSSTDNNGFESLENIDLLFREMRKDLGESNRNIDNKDLIGLYIIGGKEAIAQLSK